MKVFILFAPILCCAIMMPLAYAAEDRPLPSMPTHLSGKYFDKITVTADRITIKFLTAGEKYLYKKNDGQLEKSEYGQEISINVGESFALIGRHHNISFLPLPEQIRQYGFEVNEEFDFRSFGKELTSTRVFIMTAKVKRPLPLQDSGIIILEPSTKAIEEYVRDNAHDLGSKDWKRGEGLQINCVKRIALLDAVVGPNCIGFETPFRVLEVLLRSVKLSDYDLYVATLEGDALKGIAPVDRANRDFDETKLLIARDRFKRDYRQFQSIAEIRYCEKDERLWAEIQARGDVDKRPVRQKMTVRFVNTSVGWRVDRVERGPIEQDKPSDSPMPTK